MGREIGELYELGHYDEALVEGAALARRPTMAECEALMEAALLLGRPDEASRWWSCGTAQGSVDFNWAMKRLRLWQHEADLPLQVASMIPKPKYARWAAEMAHNVLLAYPDDPRPLDVLRSAGIATSPYERLAPCRRPLLASPGNSGLSWLGNAFIEAGVRVESSPPLFFVKCCDLDIQTELYQNMTEETGVGEQFFYPALFWKQHFVFRNDVLVTIGHRPYPRETVCGRDVLLMMRDPCDTVWSGYHLYGKDGEPFPSFAARRVRYWNAWVDLHLGYGQHTGVVWFEDYKRDAAGTLAAALRFIGIEPDPATVRTAVESSDFSKAADVERLFRRRHGWAPLAGALARSGKAGDHRHLPEYAEVFDVIRGETADRVARLRERSLAV